LFAALCVCVCVLVRYSPFLGSINNWKRTYQRTTDFVASSLYFSFANQYLLGGGFRFQQYWCLGTSYVCVTLLSNLIYLAFRDWCLCVWVTWPRDHEIHIIWYQSLALLIRLYPFIYCIFYLLRQLFFVSSLFLVWSCFKLVSVRLSSSYVILD
jgi:hypothetical protein